MMSRFSGLKPMSMEEVLRLTALYTVARMLERDDFAKRHAERRPISVMEFLYPLERHRPIEEGHKVVSFNPPVEHLRGERFNQWMGARFRNGAASSDLERIERQKVLVAAFLLEGFDFSRFVRPALPVSLSSTFAIQELSRASADWIPCGGDISRTCIHLSVEPTSQEPHWIKLCRPLWQGYPQAWRGSDTICALPLPGASTPLCYDTAGAGDNSIERTSRGRSASTIISAAAASMIAAAANATW